MFWTAAGGGCALIEKMPSWPLTWHIRPFSLPADFFVRKPHFHSRQLAASRA